MQERQERPQWALDMACDAHMQSVQMSVIAAFQQQAVDIIDCLTRNLTIPTFSVLTNMPQ